jgi:fumarate reductase flavoprotein subunit
MHNVIPGAKAYIATLHARLLRLGGTVRAGAAVTRLHFDDAEGGRAVAGVTVAADGEEHTVRARRGVVLAAGDYAGSARLIARFKGDQFSAIEGINPRATGDGHRLAETAGADLVNMDVTYGPELRFVPPKGKTFQQLLPTRGPVAKVAGFLMPFAPRPVVNAVIRRLLVTWQHPEDALFADGAILVNRNGDRFCDETVSPEREIALADQPSKEAFIVLDERLIRRYSNWPHFVSTAPKIAYAYVQDYLRLRPDVAGEAADIITLAEHRRLPGHRLAATIDHWNRNAEGDSTRTPLTGTRWVCLGPVKAYFTTTEGGAAINEHLRVLDRDGNPIPGLYAVGQNGLGGQILWGHGLHIAWAITSGRLVGRALAAESSPPR